ncbi:MAG: choice-of-anchor V domain-containing protein [Bacteroidota bacterium]
MKFRIFYWFLSSAFFLFLFTSNTGGRAGLQNWGNTGAPGDQTPGGNARTCISCHGADVNSLISVDLAIEVKDGEGNSIATSGYVPGETYDVTVTITATSGVPAGYGFQIVALAAELNQNGDQAGSWANPATNVQIATAANTGRSYAEHNGLSTSNEFNFQWVAPAGGTGTVTLYSCGNGVNDNQSTTGDGAACGTLVLSEDTSSSISELEQQVDLTLFPNPVQDQLFLNINSQISGNYQLNIVDQRGRMLHAESLRLRSGESRFEVNIPPLHSGYYFLQVKGEKGSLSRPMIKR